LNFRPVVEKPPGTVVETPPGTVVETPPGTVAFLRQTLPSCALNETDALHGPQPFLFFALAETAYFFDSRFFNLQLLARPTTVQDKVPTFTCVERIGDARCVEAKLKVTVRSIFPDLPFAEMTVIEGLDGFADTEIAATTVPETPDRISDINTATADLRLNTAMLFPPENILYSHW
jgi:hypothetical protein